MRQCFPFGSLYTEHWVTTYSAVCPLSHSNAAEDARSSPNEVAWNKLISNDSCVIVVSLTKSFLAGYLVSHIYLEILLSCCRTCRSSEKLLPSLHMYRDFVSHNNCQMCV